jgi:GNAT superfamily N-acetyltransferase
MSKVEYRSILPAEHEAVRMFLASVGWESRVRDARNFALMMKNADRTVVAWEGEKVIGFGRALCDDSSNGYLSMVVVAPDRRHQGIGSEIVNRLTQTGGNRITWVLRAGHNSRPFWEKIGFVPSEIAMERVREE